MQVPMGPIGGLIQDAAHLRLTMDGPRILRAESRLGYTHKGTLSLMQGKSPRAAARFAARLAGDTTVAHAIAFAQAAEAASDIEAPPRAVGLRAIMLEIERIASHLATLAAVAESVGAAGPRVTAERLRERVLGASGAGFGHRLMMDCVVPGGVALDIAPEGSAPLMDALEAIGADIATLRRMVGGFAMATRLVGCARADLAMVTALAAGGVAGRAAGRRIDARMVSPLYADLDYASSVETEGDAASRCRVILAEIEESLRLIFYLLRILPDGVNSVALPQVSGEGIGCAEAARGDVWHWMRLDHGRIVSVFARDPGWALWPLAEAVLVGAPFDDVALTRASLALSVSGMDL
jgi:Ni,Fe-hydrogenase III large subunit